MGLCGPQQRPKPRGEPLVQRCLSITASFVVCAVCGVKDHHSLPNYSPLLNKPALDKRCHPRSRAGGRARRFVLVAPSLDGFATVRKTYNCVFNQRDHYTCV